MDYKIIKDEIDELNFEILRLEKELKQKIKDRDNKRTELKTAIFINSKDRLSESSIKELISLEPIEIMII